jgi:large subunit ribosomal protein L12
MEYVHAAILLHKAGKPINEETLTKVLSAADIKPDPIRVKALVASLADVDIDEAIKSSPALMPVAVAAPAAAAQAPASKEKPAEAKKEKDEEKEKEKEEAAMEGLGALFG